MEFFTIKKYNVDFVIRVRECSDKVVSSSSFFIKVSSSISP